VSQHPLCFGSALGVLQQHRALIVVRLLCVLWEQRLHIVFSIRYGQVPCGFPAPHSSCSVGGHLL
jgi:hypothetical protein